MVLFSLHLNVAPSRPTSPEKFSVPHICARFGPGGQLIKVIPNLPSEGQPALVEVHSMEVIRGQSRGARGPPVHASLLVIFPSCTAVCKTRPCKRLVPVTLHMRGFLILFGYFCAFPARCRHFKHLLWCYVRLGFIGCSLSSSTFLILRAGLGSCSFYW